MALFETAPAIMVLADADGRILMFNRSAEQLTGYAREEVIGSKIADVFLTPEWAEVVAQRFASEEAEMRRPHENPWLTKAGDERWIEWRCAPIMIRGYDRPCVLGSGVDISDRRRSFDSRASQAQSFERLVEANVMGVVIADAERISEANDVFLNMVGYSREDLERGRLLWKAMTPPEYLALDERALIELQRDGTCTPFEKEYYRKDGTRVPILIGAARTDPVQLRWICFVLDLSSSRNNEAELRRQNHSLLRSNEELNSFAYSVSHDLQEPLRVMSSFSELLVRRYAAGVSGEAQEMVGQIRASADRMRQMISDLLQYSRVAHDGAGDDALKEEISMSAVMDYVVGNLAMSIRDTSASVTWGSLPIVRAQFGRIAQLMQNLVSNSIKYRRPDEPPQIEVSADDLGDAWLFRVSDNGVGIPVEHQQGIFGLFRRLHGRDVPGTGVGLAICKRIVEQNGGRIWVESDGTEGSSFCFTLPYASHSD